MDDAAEVGATEVGAVRCVFAYRTDRPIDRPAALEVASLLGTGVVLVPAQGWVLAVPAAPEVEPFTPWSRRQRPVLSLRREAGGVVEVSAYLRGAGRSGGLGTRALEHSMPGWWWSSSDQRRQVLVTGEQRAGLDEATAATLARLLAEPDPAATAAFLAQLSPTGLDLQRLLAVNDTTTGTTGDATGTTTDGPNDGAGGAGGATSAVTDDVAAEVVTAEVVAALGLPQVTARLLTGEVAAADLPGAVTAEHRGPLGTIVQTLLARPEGTSPLARMRRWDHDHPARSLAYVATLTSLAALGYALAATEGHALSRRPWPRALTVTATALSLDAAANAALLAIVRRRLRSA